MHARQLIESLARDEVALRGQAFLAPLLADGRAHMRICGLVYTMRIVNARPGWWLCEVLDARHARIVDAAPPWQRDSYLAVWPALRLVLVEPLRGDDWLALAFNPADAMQRFGLHGPLIVRMVAGGQPFERIIGRVEGNTIWFDQLDRRADPAIAEGLRAALADDCETLAIAGLGVGERASYALLRNRRVATAQAGQAIQLDQRLREALRIGGAQLIGYDINDGIVRVTWERAGLRSVTLVNPHLDVVSAGICLSGEDQHFDLASIIGVVQDAPAFAR
jgi:hypothetical protein